MNVLCCLLLAVVVVVVAGSASVVCCPSMDTRYEEPLFFSRVLSGLHRTATTTLLVSGITLIIYIKAGKGG